MRFKVGHKVILLNNDHTRFDIGSQGSVAEVENARYAIVSFTDQTIEGRIHRGTFKQCIHSEHLVEDDIVKTKLWKVLA